MEVMAFFAPHKESTLPLQIDQCLNPGRLAWIQAVKADNGKWPVYWPLRLHGLFFGWKTGQ